MTKEIARSASSSSGFRLQSVPARGPPASVASRRSWCGRLPLQREENQDDSAHRDNQSDSSSSHGECDSWAGRSRGDKQPATLEELLDLELDVHLSAAESRGANTGNQFAPSDFRLANLSDISLELLALQSPHGRSESWQENEDDRAFLPRDVLFEPKEVPPPIDVPELRKASSTASSDGTMDLASPGEHIPAFPPSPTHRASDGDYGMTSPLSLPESPTYSSQAPSHQAEHSDRWNVVPQLELDDDAMPNATLELTAAMAESKARTKGVTASRPRRPRHRSSASPPRANNAHARSPPRSVYSGRKPKAKHGGIYSLLLKFKPPEQEPVLVDDLRSPDLAGPAPASTTQPPPSAAQPQHGGIYRMLRRSASQRQ